MKITIVPSERFKKSFKRLSRKYVSLKSDYLIFEQELIEDYELGISLGGGFRKVRLAIHSKSKGKSGGARIITYGLLLKIEEGVIILVDIYDKSEKETLTEKEYIKILQDFINNEL
ncbi:hypothetical protein SAMN05216357_11643 [Porphyromonadaceae bacterium KH3CP3RA]|nr:hypothetical protein SAMN05216357_11643 [Porphyromonadaceae bacterium KH3CP3RA]